MGDAFMDYQELWNCLERRERERTFEFNLMLVGLENIGKSTLVRCLTDGGVNPRESDGSPQLNEYTALLEELGVKLRLKCVETSAYQAHNIDEYVNYLEKQFVSHFREQIRKPAWRISDSRIHCCIYMIPPYNKLKLKQEDIDCMKALHTRVNLVPVIANADKLDLNQAKKFKESILADLIKHEIQYFQFQYDPKEDEDRFKCVQAEARRFPFAVVAADEKVLVENKEKWLRKTLQSSIDIWDSNICDFSSLQKLLFRHCMINLMESTNHIYDAKVKQILQQSKEQHLPLLTHTSQLENSL